MGTRWAMADSKDMTTIWVTGVLIAAGFFWLIGSTPSGTDTTQAPRQEEPAFVQPRLNITDEHQPWQLKVSLKNVGPTHIIHGSESDFRLRDGNGTLHQNDYSSAHWSNEPFPYSEELHPGERVEGWLVFKTAAPEDTPHPFLLMYRDDPIHVQVYVQSTVSA